MWVEIFSHKATKEPDSASKSQTLLQLNEMTTKPHTCYNGLVVTSISHMAASLLQFFILKSNSRRYQLSNPPSKED